MNIDQILSMKLAETLDVDGLAPNVVEAHNIAWRALENVIGTDGVAAWQLKAMQHKYTVVRDEACVAFKAEFARRPDEDAS